MTPVRKGWLLNADGLLCLIGHPITIKRPEKYGDMFIAEFDSNPPNRLAYGILIAAQKDAERKAVEMDQFKPVAKPDETKEELANHHKFLRDIIVELNSARDGLINPQASMFNKVLMRVDAAIETVARYEDAICTGTGPLASAPDPSWKQDKDGTWRHRGCDISIIPGGDKSLNLRVKGQLRSRHTAIEAAKKQGEFIAYSQFGEVATDDPLWKEAFGVLYHRDVEIHIITPAFSSSDGFCYELFVNHCLESRHDTLKLAQAKGELLAVSEAARIKAKGSSK